jgi:hypothetical protein
VCYLGCLAEFGAHARATDEAAGVHIPFNFPFIIDGDKVRVKGLEELRERAAHPPAQSSCWLVMLMYIASRQ